MRTALRQAGIAARTPRTMVAAAASWLALAAPAHANLVTNGGFEADVTTAGPVSPPSGWTVANDAGADRSFPFAGTNDAFLGIGLLSQSIATVGGGAYTLSFELAPDPTVLQDAAATMTVSFGGAPVATITRSSFPSTAYKLFSYQVVGGPASAALVFNAFTTADAGNWYLDEVTVNAAAGATPVPEPGSAGLLGAALAGLLAAGARARRRARG